MAVKAIVCPGELIREAVTHRRPLLLRHVLALVGEDASYHREVAMLQ